MAAIRMFFSWLIGKEVLEKNSAREAENPLLFT